MNRWAVAHILTAEAGILGGAGDGRSLTPCAGSPRRRDDSCCGGVFFENYGVARNRRCPDVREGCRPHLPEKLRGLPSSWRSRAVFAPDVRRRGAPSTGAQGLGAVAKNAAVVRRSPLREVLEHHESERGRNRNGFPVGRRRRSGGGSTRSAEARGLGRGMGHRQTGHGVRAAAGLRRSADGCHRLSARHRSDELHGGSLDSGSGGASDRAHGRASHHRVRARAQIQLVPRPEAGRFLHRSSGEDKRRARYERVAQ